MKKLFKDIRHNDIDAVRKAIEKNPNVVNEYFDGKAPKKDIGQSPLQVAIKCARFEIIELLLENDADVDFMEDPKVVPPRSTCMSVIHDAIIGAMDSLLYKHYELSQKYVVLIEVMLQKGADPNKKTFHEGSSITIPPVGTLINHASYNLNQYRNTIDRDITAFETSKNNLFKILDLLKRYGADFEKWFDDENWGGGTNRAAFLDEFIPKEGIENGHIDYNREIRAALQAYFKVSRSECTQQTLLNDFD